MSQQLPLSLDETLPRRRRTGTLRSFHAQGQPVTVDEALDGERKARAQEFMVALFFVARGVGPRFTPSQVWDGLERQWPLTSIRRALTNLSDAGRYESPPLQHHPTDRRPGPRGARESTWSLSEATR